MDWQQLDQHLTEDKKASLQLAKDFIDGRIQDVTKNKNKIIYSIEAMANAIHAVANKPDRDAIYQHVSVALCDRRDVLREKLHLDAQVNGRLQVNAFSKDTEGALFLNAVATIHRPFVIMKTKEWTKEKKGFDWSRHSYTFDDLLQVSIYGTFLQKQDDATADSEFTSKGLLVGFMKYNPVNETDASFATYASIAIKSALTQYAKNERGKLTMLRIPGDIEQLEGKYPNRLQEIFTAPPPSDPELPDIIRNMLSELTSIHPLAPTLVMARVTEGTQITELAGQYGLTEDRINLILAKSMRKLQIDANKVQPFAQLPHKNNAGYDLSKAAADTRLEEKQWRDKLNRQKASKLPSFTICIAPTCVSEQKQKTLTSFYTNILQQIYGVKIASDIREDDNLTVDVHDGHEGKPGLYLTVTGKDTILKRVIPVLNGDNYATLSIMSR